MLRGGALHLDYLLILKKLKLLQFVPKIILQMLQNVANLKHGNHWTRNKGYKYIHKSSDHPKETGDRCFLHAK